MLLAQHEGTISIKVRLLFVGTIMLVQNPTLVINLCCFISYLCLPHVVHARVSHGIRPT